MWDSMVREKGVQQKHPGSLYPEGDSSNSSSSSGEFIPWWWLASSPQRESMENIRNVSVWLELGGWGQKPQLIPHRSLFPMGKSFSVSCHTHSWARPITTSLQGHSETSLSNAPDFASPSVCNRNYKHRRDCLVVLFIWIVGWLPNYAHTNCPIFICLP